MTTKKRWVSIGVTEELRDLIKQVSKRENIRMYQVVEIAIRRYLTEQKYKRRDREYHAGYTIDKELWYAFKLVNSIAQLKFVVEEFDEESKVKQYHKLTLKTISQIEERLGIDLDNVKKAIEKFVDNPNGVTKAKLNDETKVAMARILFQ